MAITSALISLCGVLIIFVTFIDSFPISNNTTSSSESVSINNDTTATNAPAIRHTKLKPNTVLDCQFINLVATCVHRIDQDYKAYVTAIVNHCNNPVDVTFSVSVDSHSQDVSWTHTFVNSHEVEKIHDLSKDVQLHVTLEYLTDTTLHVQAEFHIDNKPETGYFIDSAVAVDSGYSCGSLSSTAGTIALITFIVIIVLTIIAIPAIIYWRRWRHRTVRDSLVDNMVPPSRTKVYQDHNGAKPRHQKKLKRIREESESELKDKKSRRKSGDKSRRTRGRRSKALSSNSKVISNGHPEFMREESQCV